VDRGERTESFPEPAAGDGGRSRRDRHEVAVSRTSRARQLPNATRRHGLEVSRTQMRQRPTPDRQLWRGIMRLVWWRRSAGCQERL
jgi:hypothetical protein